MGGNPLAAIQELHSKGLLPMLLQKLGIQGDPSAAQQPQEIPKTSPSQAQQTTPPVGTPPGSGGGGAAPQGGGGPQVKYDPSGGGTAMPPMEAQPHEAFQSVFKLLAGWSDRKKKGEEAEAKNVFSRLTKAQLDGDQDTIDLIKNDPHQMKLLDKVYKGWRTASEQAQKPGKPPDPATSGAEAGITEATKASNQQRTQQRPPQGQPPGSAPQGAGGFQPPRPSQAEQLKAAGTSAELQAAKQDPNRLLGSRLTSGEMRETELGAGPEKVRAEQAKAQAVIDKAASDTKRAMLEVQKVEAELALKKTEIAGAESKGKITTDIETKKYLKAVVDLDIARERLKLSITKTKAGTNISFVTKLKMAAIDKAIAIASKIQDEKRSFSASDFGNLATELRAAGATELVKKLPQNWLSAHLLSDKSDVTDLIEALQHYKESYQTVLDGLGAPADKSAADASAGDEGEGDDDSVMEGDVVEFEGKNYKFKGGDPAVRTNWDLLDEKKP